MLPWWQFLIDIQCKWSADKRLTQPKIKKNMCRWTKNCHYTWDCIRIDLSFISSHGEDLGLRSLGTLRSKTTLWLRSGSDSRLYCYLTKTLSKGPMLARLSDWTRIIQDQAKLFYVSSFSAVETHLWMTTSAKMKLPVIWTPLYPRSLSALESKTCRWSTKLRWLWSSEGLWRTNRIRAWPKRILEEYELLLFFEDCLEMKLKPFLFWKLLRDILSLINFSALKTNWTTSL